MNTKVGFPKECTSILPYLMLNEYSHNEAICTRPKLAYELPPFLNMKDLAE